MKRTSGFTVIELLLAIVVLGSLTILFFIQKNNLDAITRDSQRKVAINAMYYNLEQYYYPQNGYYPDHINSGVLKAMDPELFTDPNGVKLGDDGANYRYQPTNCSLDGKCKSYSLRADLEREADYVKQSLHQ